MKRWLPIALAVLLAPFASAQDAPLRYHFQAGASIRTQDVATQEVSTDMGGMQQKIKFETTSINQKNIQSAEADGAAHLVQRTESVRGTAQSPLGNEEFDSADPKSTPGMFLKAAAALVGNDIGYTVSARGEVSDVTGLEVLAKAVEGIPGVDAESQIAQAKNGFSQSFPVLPENGIKEGDSWDQEIRNPIPMLGDLILTFTYTYAGVREVAGRSCLHFDAEIEASFEAPAGMPAPITVSIDRGEGTVDIEQSTGLPVASTSSLSMTMSIDLSSLGQQGKMEQKLVSESKSTPVEENGAEPPTTPTTPPTTKEY